MSERPASAFTEYDFLLCIDRSGSMGTPTSKFPSRWEEAKELTSGIATFAAQVDDDGITLIAFGGSFKADRDVVDGVKANAVFDFFAKNTPSGSTPLDAALNAAFAKHFSSPKKSVIVVVTDGVPDNKDAVVKAIKDAAGKLDDASQIRILFVQIGEDAAAASYLDDLDNHLSGAKFDIVNVVSFQAANGLSPTELMSRALDDTH